MSKKLRISIPLILASLFGASLSAPALAASQDDYFWANVQLTEGIQAGQASPMPTATQIGEAQAQDWFALERQKTDGFIADASAKPARAVDARSSGAVIAREASR